MFHEPILHNLCYKQKFHSYRTFRNGVRGSRTANAHNSAQKHWFLLIIVTKCQTPLGKNFL